MKLSRPKHTQEACQAAEAPAVDLGAQKAAHALPEAFRAQAQAPSVRALATMMSVATGSAAVPDYDHPPVDLGIEAPLPQIDTPEFKAWFGESKVAREGQPLVVYHGTSLESRSHYSGTPDVINFDYEGPKCFSSSPAQAKSYSRGHGASIVQVYLSIQNPYVITEEVDGGFAYLSGEDAASIYDDVNYLSEQGFDGAVWREANHPDVWVAFRSEQIRFVL